MAQSASLAESKALAARQNLENYVFGTSVSTVPPVIPPMQPPGAVGYNSYPYNSSPTQWPVGTPPLAQASVDVHVHAVVGFRDRQHRPYDDFF